MSTTPTDQAYIGLEIHVQLNTTSKLFCDCAVTVGGEANSAVCPVCLGHPGTLPVLNGEALFKAYVLAEALGCTTASTTIFERKSYFYPDLPRNYQISQFARPIGERGIVRTSLDGRQLSVAIRECHLEEDAGKMIHAGDVSLLDYNRAGTPLLEIVTEPTLETGAEAEAVLHEMRRIVRYLGVGSGNMEEGSLRCDANISVNRRGAGLGTKVEIKNLNSARFVRLALDFEFRRQTSLIADGGSVVTETRLWNENRDITQSMRRKETAADYRFFPDPDLPKVSVNAAFRERVTAAQVELPNDRSARFESSFGLGSETASFLCSDRDTADFFEETVAHGGSPTEVAHWLMGDVRKELNRRRLGLGDSPLTPVRLAQVLSLLSREEIHGKIAKRLLPLVFDLNEDPDAIIEKKRWRQIVDPDVLRPVVVQVMEEHAEAVATFRSGDARTFSFLIGQIMRSTDGLAHPRVARDVLTELLEGSPIHLITFGGAIEGHIDDSGMIVSGDLAKVQRVLTEDDLFDQRVRFHHIPLGGFLSEEVTPHDWATLVTRVRALVEHDSYSPVVITHGTDTLSYTAPLLHWLFSASSLPVVLAATGEPLVDSDDARREVIGLVRDIVPSLPGGVHVSVGGLTLPGLNVHFASTSPPVFRTWNGVDAASVTESEISRRFLDAPENVWEGVDLRLKRAVDRSAIVRVYPGMRSDRLDRVIDDGVDFVILELYGTGTAAVSAPEYSVRRSIERVAVMNKHFYCTSQQETEVVLSNYVTGHELWRRGARSLGRLSTATAYAKLLAAQLVGESDEDVAFLMSTE